MAHHCSDCIARGVPMMPMAAHSCLCSLDGCRSCRDAVASSVNRAAEANGDNARARFWASIPCIDTGCDGKNWR